MGYYTNYDFSKNSKEIIEEIEKISDYGDSYGGYYQEVKWYKCFDNLKEISLNFPDEVIIIEGEGEESGDVWKSQFKNGVQQYQKAKIIYDDFNEWNGYGDKL